MPIEIQYGYHWLIPAMYICWDKVCAENYCDDGFMLEYGVAKRLCLRKGKTLDVFSEKRYDDDEFPRKEGYILWQSRSSPFNFQNLCFFCKIKGPYNSIIKYRQCGQTLSDRVYGQTKLFHLQNDSCAEFYDTLNTEFKLTVKMQILGRSTALTLLSKSQIS